MSETAREEVEADIEDHDGEVGSKTALQHKDISNKAEKEKVNSDCDPPLAEKVSELKSPAEVEKSRFTMKPLTTKKGSLFDLDEFVNIVSQKSLVTEDTNNELEQWKGMLEKPPSKFKIGKSQLTSLLQKHQTDALPTLPALKSPNSNQSLSESFTFESAPFESVLKRNETDFNDDHKDGNIEEQVEDDENEFQNDESSLKFLENTEELSSIFVPFNEFRSQITYNEGLLEISLGEKFIEYVFVVCFTTKF